MVKIFVGHNAVLPQLADLGNSSNYQPCAYSEIILLVDWIYEVTELCCCVMQVKSSKLPGMFAYIALICVMSIQYYLT